MDGVMGVPRTLSVLDGKVMIWAGMVQPRVY